MIFVIVVAKKTTLCSNGKQIRKKKVRRRLKESRDREE